MCHPWLGAGTVCLVAFVVVRKLAETVRLGGSQTTALENGLLGMRLRRWFRRRIAPIVEVFLRMGLTPNAVTFSQLGGSVLCGVAYAQGWMFSAGLVLLTCGTLDVLDGEMARRQGRAGPRGAFLDSVVDRYAEAAIFAGLVAFYRHDWVLWSVLAAWAGAFLVSYTRARAESLGVECREGLLQRPERYVILGGSSMLSAVLAVLVCNPNSQHGLVAVGLSVLAILANATALQRARQTLRRLA